MNEHIEAELRSADVLAQEVRRISFVDRLVQGFNARHEFTARIDVSTAGAERPRGDDEAFDQAVRIFEDQEVILVRASFAFVRVHHDVHGLPGIAGHEAPLHPGRESGAATAAEAGMLHEIDRLGLRKVKQA